MTGEPSDAGRALLIAEAAALRAGTFVVAAIGLATVLILDELAANTDYGTLDQIVTFGIFLGFAVIMDVLARRKIKQAKVREHVSLPADHPSSHDTQEAHP